MKKVNTFSQLCLTLMFILILFVNANGQNTEKSADTTKSSTGSLLLQAGNSSAIQADQSKITVTPGSELQGGIGNFGDPSTHHGFTLALNGTLGISSKLNTFGYDAFSVNTRWVPGSNSFGKRIIIQFGAANWFTPALSVVYKDTVLNSKEKLAEAQTVNNIMAGLSFQLANNREIDESDFTDDVRAKLQIFDSQLVGARNNAIQTAAIKRDIEAYMWSRVIRNSLRKFSAIVGGTFRLGSLGTETDVTAADLFATAAVGKNIFDCVGSIHYLKPLKDQLIAKDAITGNIGFFFDLDDLPPINTMGVSFGLGRYNYLEKKWEIEVNKVKTVLTDKPNTVRFDVTLSFSGLFRDLGPFGSSIGFRYSYLNNSSTASESQVVVLFTTKFINKK